MTDKVTVKQVKEGCSADGKANYLLTGGGKITCLRCTAKSTRTKLIKGKRKKVKLDSDWQTYYGSNAELKEDVKTLGGHLFNREIFKLCKSKGTANYWEMKYQIQHEVLERPDDYYNQWIIVKVHRSHIKN